MRIKLENVRLSFPRLFTAEAFQGQGDAKFSARFIVEPGSAGDKAIREAIAKVAAEKWPKTTAKVLGEIQTDKKAFCYVDGDRYEWAGAAGNWVLTANRKEKDGRPLVIDQLKRPLVESDGKPYAGCYVNASVEFWAQDGANKGIRCVLRAVQFARDGDAFGGGASASVDEFDVIAAGAEAEDLC